jgi:hypothetical protein
MVSDMVTSPLNGERRTVNPTANAKHRTPNSKLAGSRIRPHDGGADSAAFSEREFSNGLFPFLLFLFMFGTLLLNGREAAV